MEIITKQGDMGGPADVAAGQPDRPGKPPFYLNLYALTLKVQLHEIF
jgi:hypothetical protein